MSDYFNLITYYKEKYNLTSNQLFTYGSSMGGYAALLYGIKLKVNAIFALRPQINYATAINTFAVQKLEGKFIDIDDMIKSEVSQLPKIYLTYGEFHKDKAAAFNLLDTLKNRANQYIIVHKTNHPSHDKAFYPSKKYIDDTFNYLSTIDLNDSPY